MMLPIELRFVHFLGALLLFLLLAPGCGPSSEPATGERRAGLAADTVELRQLYDSIDVHHRQLLAQSRQMEGRMPPVADQIYRAMEQMHESDGDMHGRMMAGMAGGQGMGPGMMGGMGGFREMGQVHEWDWQMETMHARMADYMGEHGLDEMAALHERMAGLWAVHPRS